MIDGLRQWGTLPRRVYRELQGMEAGDRMLEAYDEEDAASPAATPEAADDRLTTYLAGIATAIAVGTMMAAPRQNVDADGRDVTPEDLFGEAELDGAGEDHRRRAPRCRSAPSSSGTTSRGETLDEAAASLGLSKSWGSRLHARAIESIGKELRRTRRRLGSRQ